MRTWHLDPRNPNCSLVGLKDVYNRSEDMELMRTGQSKMEVNQMYTEEGVSEEPVWDNVNQLTASGECYFCKKPGHQRRECRSYASWKAKSSERRGEHRDVGKVTCYKCNKKGHFSRDCRPFEIYTEAFALKYMDSLKNQSGLFMSWYTQLAGYVFKVK